MPSQLIHLSAAALDTILDPPWFPLMHGFGIRDLQAESGFCADGSKYLRVHLAPLVHCPDLRNPFVDDVYGLVLTSAAPACYPPLPPPLPPALVSHLLIETGATLQEFPHLNGHERLEIEAAITEARRAKSVSRQARRRSPGSAYEFDLQRKAEALQASMGPALARLDRKLRSYKSHMRKSGLEAVPVRLGLQAELGFSLDLEPLGKTFQPLAQRESRRGGLADLMRTTHNQLNVFQEMAEAVYAASVRDVCWLLPDKLPRFHHMLLAGIPGMERAGKLRCGEMRIRSPFDGHVRVVEMPGTEVADAFAEFAAGFDAALWCDIHPAIRAALAHVEFARIHPFSDGNGRMARLIIQAMLMESGVSGLPLEAIFCWNRSKYLDVVIRAVRLGATLGFLQFLLHAIDQAIAVGRIMTRVIKPQCDGLRDRFLELKSGQRLALHAGIFAGSMVLGPDPQTVRRTIHGIELGWYLGDCPELDIVEAKELGFNLTGYRSDVAYSSPMARALLASPLLLM